MAKVVYNACFGGFSLSPSAVRLGREISGNQKWGDADEKYGFIEGIERHDPVLVRVVEELGRAASGSCAKLAVKEIPSGTLYRIDEYDGSETVMTNSDYDWTVAP